jgi:phosphoglycolate phosphatase
MKKAVIFDFDGTIADSFDYVFDFLREAAGNTHEFTPTERRELRQMSMKRLALHLGVPFWKLIPTYFRGRRVMRAQMEHVHSFKGMPEAISELHKAGHGLYVVSANSAHNIRILLRKQGLESYFHDVQGGAGYAGKAALIQKVMRRKGLSRENTWYVGDETSDVVAAARAGIPCLAVAWGFADPAKMREMEPDAFAERPADIPKLLAEI